MECFEHSEHKTHRYRVSTINDNMILLKGDSHVTYECLSTEILDNCLLNLLSSISLVPIQVVLFLHSCLLLEEVGVVTVVIPRPGHLVCTVNFMNLFHKMKRR